MMNSGISGAVIPEAAEKRDNKLATEITKAHSEGMREQRAFEPEGRGALESGIRNTGGPKRKELEKHVCVHLSEDNSDQELMAHKQRHVSRSLAALDRIDKVKISTIPDVQGCKCGLVFAIEGSWE